MNRAGTAGGEPGEVAAGGAILVLSPQSLLASRWEGLNAAREDYDNGHSYYPMHGSEIAVPGSPENAPSAGFIEWHNENVFRAA